MEIKKIILPLIVVLSLGILTSQIIFVSSADPPVCSPSVVAHIRNDGADCTDKVEFFLEGELINCQEDNSAVTIETGETKDVTCNSIEIPPPIFRTEVTVKWCNLQGIIAYGTEETITTTTTTLHPSGACEEKNCQEIYGYITNAITTLGADKNELLDEKLIKGLIKKESVYHQCCFGQFIGQTCEEGEILSSWAGALGLMQLMPTTASWLGVDPHDAGDNVKGGVKYLNWLLNNYFYKYNEEYGNRQFALAAYNCGQGNILDAIQKYCEDGGIAEADCTWRDYLEAHIDEFCLAETKNHVNQIMGWYNTGNVECEGILPASTTTTTLEGCTGHIDCLKYLDINLGCCDTSLGSPGTCAECTADCGCYEEGQSCSLLTNTCFPPTSSTTTFTTTSTTTTTTPTIPKCGKKDQGVCKESCSSDEKSINDDGKCSSDKICCMKKDCHERCVESGYKGGNCKLWCSYLKETPVGGCGLLNLFPCCCEVYPLKVEVAFPITSVFLVGEEILFDGRVEGGAPPYDYSWTIMGPFDQESYKEQELTTKSLTMSFTEIGRYRASLWVDDSIGNFELDSMRFEILDTPLEAECVGIIKNGDPQNKIDVLFLPSNYKPGKLKYSFKADVNSMIHQGILSVEPFKSNAEKFNFYRIDFDVEAHIFMGINSEAWKLRGICPSEDVTIFLDPSFGTGGATIGFVIVDPYAVYRKPAENIIIGPKQMLLHEFGHALGLVDEYRVPLKGYGKVRGSRESPNCDPTPGCPKWCSGPPLEPYETECTSIKTLEDCLSVGVDCEWYNEKHPFFKTHCIGKIGYTNIGTDCLEGTGCYHNCGGIDGWRPVQDLHGCLMNHGTQYCPVCTRYLEEYLSHYN